MICRNCGKLIADSSRFCPYCGKEQSAPKKFCTHCGMEIDLNAVVCTHCGVMVGQTEPLFEQPRTAFCTHCGKPIDPNASVCVYCGRLTGKTEFSGPQKRTGYVLAIVSIVLNFISLGFVSAILAALGMTFAIRDKDNKAIRLNLWAIGVCAVMSALIIIIGMMSYSGQIPIDPDLIKYLRASV